MTRVLWLGDAGSHTGFARVTHSIGDRLATTYGYDMHVLAVNHRGDYYPTPMKLYVPTIHVGSDVYGKSRIVELMSKLEPDVVVMLNDPALIVNILHNNRWDSEKYLIRYRPILAYMPIDGHNLPPQWDELKKYVHRVAMTKFGQSFMPEAPLVYHGVDTDLFWPVSSQRPITTSTGVVCKTKRDCKEAFGYPKDSFLVLRVDRNSGRKDYPASWKALQPVMERHSDIVVHFHCQGVDDTMGVDMPSLFSRNQETKPRFFLPDMLNTWLGWKIEDLNCLYNASDIFLSTSRGEGFGLTIAEALACGVPVIAQNVTAIPEVVGPGGILLEPQREITVPSGEDQWLCDIGAFSEAIETLYLSRSKRRSLGQQGAEHVRTSFSWDFAAGRFHDFIDALASGKEVAHGSS